MKNRFSLLTVFYGRHRILFLPRILVNTGYLAILFGTMILPLVTGAVRPGNIRIWTVSAIGITLALHGIKEYFLAANSRRIAEKFHWYLAAKTGTPPGSGTTNRMKRMAGRILLILLLAVPFYGITLLLSAGQVPEYVLSLPAGFILAVYSMVMKPGLDIWLIMEIPRSGKGKSPDN